jgi:hypothetical protein
MRKDGLKGKPNVLAKESRLIEICIDGISRVAHP